jgi:hypothetical protein
MKDKLEKEQFNLMKNLTMIILFLFSAIKPEFSNLLKDLCDEQVNIKSLFQKMYFTVKINETNCLKSVVLEIR